MAFKETITFDRTEMIVYAKLGKRPAILNLTYERIISIRLDHGTMPFLRILKKPSDRILIQLRRMENPVILYSAVLGEQFDGLAEGVRRFCKENRVTLYDYLAHPENQ